jgi:hypothetical protein
MEMKLSSDALKLLRSSARLSNRLRRRDVFDGKVFPGVLVSIFAIDDGEQA